MIFTTGACFATKNDALILQHNIEAVRTEMRQSIARSDAERRAQLDSILRAVAALQDTIRSFEYRTLDRSADVAGGQNSLQRLVNQIMARLDVSDAALKSLAEQVGLIKEQLGRLSASMPADSLAEPVSGPIELLLAARDQLARSATGTARSVLADLLEKYPNDSLAAAAQYEVGESFAIDRDKVSADSVFRLVYEKYPKSAEFAPRALWRHALYLVDSGQKADEIYRKIVAEYPTSTEAGLAKEKIPPNH